MAFDLNKEPPDEEEGLLDLNQQPDDEEGLADEQPDDEEPAADQGDIAELNDLYGAETGEQEGAETGEQEVISARNYLMA
nr:unnamed protein product [Digitaria exilis]